MSTISICSVQFKNDEYYYIGIDKTLSAAIRWNEVVLVEDMGKDVEELIKLGESVRVEFKEMLPRKTDLARAISSFANSEGGTLLIGVNDPGKVIGTQYSEELNRIITDVASSSCEPPVRVKIDSLEIDGKTVISVSVPKCEELCSAGGRFFIRVGSTIRRLTPREIRKLMFEKGMVDFDEIPVDGATLDDIDEERVRWFLRKARAERNYDVDPDTEMKEVLERLNLLEEGKLTTAAVLMFGKDPQVRILQSKIRCARFKGTDGMDYIDMKVLKGTIPELREDAIKFIMQHTRHAVFFDANRRYDRWEYPFRALEEALSNALAHRDYFSKADIQLSIYDNRIEIWNPGELPGPLTLADLKRKHKSIPRNKLLAGTLFLIGYIEEWGRGTNRIVEECLRHDLPEPEFQLLSGGLEVTICGPGKDFEKTVEQTAHHSLDVNQRQKKAITYLNKNDTVTTLEYCKINRIGTTLAKRELNDMRNKGIIRRVGKGRATHYVLVSD